jgi:hypothetical protein
MVCVKYQLSKGYRKLIVQNCGVYSVFRVMVSICVLCVDEVCLVVLTIGIQRLYIPIPGTGVEISIMK